MTTTMGEVTETISLEELLDFDIMCGYLVNSSNDCPNAAKYDAETNCCGYHNFLCQEHLDVILASEIPPFGFGCAHCRDAAWFNSIEEWLTIIPI